MTAAPELAVTGSTGQLGGLVARQLAAAGSPQRLLVRDAARAPDLPGAVPAVVAYADPAGAKAALEGVKTLFMVSAAEAEDRLQQHCTFVDAAAAAGVQHIVYTSFFGAAADSTFTLGRDHFATEERIKASGMDFTFLRDNFYLDFLPLLAGADGVIRGPAGDGVMAAVARADVARSAVTVLRDPALHVGRTYDLTGPEDLSLARAAELLTCRDRPDHHVPQRDARGGLRLAGLLWRPAVAGGRLGEHVHGDRRRRTRRADVGRARAHGPGTAGPGAVPGGVAHDLTAEAAAGRPSIDGFRAAA